MYDKNGNYVERKYGQSSKRKNTSNFQRGTGCFHCAVCGKLTRQSNNNTDLCKKCYAEAEEENERSDEKFTPPTSDQIHCPGCDGQNNDYRLDYEAGSMEFNVYECLECGQRFTVRIK